MMSQSLFDSEHTIDLNKWHKLQDSLSLVTKMAIILVDYKGVPVTKHSHCQSFCQSVRADPNLSKYCQKCDSHAGLEAARLNKPYIYLCHFNIVDIAIPIIFNNQYIGAIMAGQIKLRDEDTAPLEQIITRPAHLDDLDKLPINREHYNNLPLLSYEEVESIADMLFHMSTYIVGEMIHKNVAIDMYKNVLSGEIDQSTLETLKDRSLQAFQEGLSSALREKEGKQSQKIGSPHSVLQPALDYIYTHKNENYTLQEMAAICHISSSYFSRLFSREMGESFSMFVARLKIEWSKELITTTNLSITQIGEQLGYCDAGYFIKTFKKFESVTPAVYREIVTQKRLPHKKR